MPNSSYYPLAVGNTWTYKLKDGRTFSNKVTSVEGGTYAMASSMAASLSHIKKEGDAYLTDSIEPGKWLVILKENLNKGEGWQIEFNANGFASVLVYTVKDTGINKEVEGVHYDNVLVIEADSKLNTNGNITSLNFLTQYYYAKGIGLILTTSSHGDEMPLTACQVE